MKNSKGYSKKIQALYRKLKGKGAKTEKVTYDDPVDALIFGIIAESMSEEQSQAAIKRFSKHFIDNNDLRVSLPEEVVGVLGSDTNHSRQIANNLGNVLMNIFESFNAISLSDLKKVGKRSAKESLEKIEGISRFVLDYCMLTSLAGHAIPLNARMIDYLKDNKLVDPNAESDDIGGFLTRQISAKNGYEFYSLLRQQSDTARGKKKAVKAKKAVKKADKKVRKKAKKTPKKAAKKVKKSATKKVKKKTKKTKAKKKKG